MLTGQVVALYCEICDRESRQLSRKTAGARLACDPCNSTPPPITVTLGQQPDLVARLSADGTRLTVPLLCEGQRALVVQDSE